MEVSSVALYSYLLDDLYGIDRTRDDLPTGVYPGASPDAVARYSLARSFLRKLSDEEAADAKQRCFEKFLAANQRAGEWRLTCRGSWDEQLVGTFQRVVDEFFYPDGEPMIGSYFDLLGRGRAGPGASLGANGEDFFTKFFASELTTTSSELYQMYNEWCCWFPILRDAEISRVLTHGSHRLTLSSSMSFVRKTRDIARSICTEPSLNMFYQLGLGDILSDRLRSHFGVLLASQQVMNRDLACRGSIDGSVVTIDLESASDCVSLGMCEEFLPDYLMDILYRLRTPFTRVHGREIKLNMVSTMGNGFTFPLQTVLFCCVVEAAARDRFGKDWLGRADRHPQWGVFGDDIICPREISSRVCRLLHLLGFVVNSDKSFFEGPFRESCGGDYYEGVNVRGVYIKSLRTIQNRYVAINLLNEWSARTGIPLPRTVGYLKDSVPGLAVPAHEAPDAGIRVPYPSLIGGEKYHSGKQRFLYRCYEVTSPVLTFDATGCVTTPRVRGKRIKVRRSNPCGALHAFIGGYIRSRKVGSRTVSEVALPLKQGESPTYRTRWKVSPFWGPDTNQLLTQGGWDFWKRWNSAAEDNLMG